MVDALDPVGLTPAVRSSLADRSDGIPLYLELTVCGWVGARQRTGSPDRGGSARRVVRALVARLLSSDAGVTVAGARSHDPSEADRALLGALVDLDPADLTRELDALTAGTILVATGRRDNEYQFRHELLREVAYELQPAATRRRLTRPIQPRHLGLDAESPWRRRLESWPASYRRASTQRAAAPVRRIRPCADEPVSGGDRKARSSPSGAHQVEHRGFGRRDRDGAHVKVALRLRRGFLAMSVEGAQAAPSAAADYGPMPEPRGSRRRRRGDVPHAHRRVGVLRRPGRARARAPGAHDAPAGPDRPARLLDAVQHRRLRDARLVRGELRSCARAARGRGRGGTPRRKPT